ncbi:MAG: chemotaxis-specific protein-glutamate methyltransferase CheB [Acidimicrobiia bacterium]|nr:chemotaxis-specific protein-glutamate methyltransferase CheB [Acidimicrobiia bacterium]
MSPIRVLVVEDSLTVRRYLVDVLSRDPAFTVVGEAGSGRAAVQLTGQLSPDVVTMDIVMPGGNGLEATEQIMAHRPTPILIVSSATNRGEQFSTCHALAAGAVDVLDKPDAQRAGADWERRFLLSVKLVSRVRVITHPRGMWTALPERPAAAVPLPGTGPVPRVCRAVAIGASTGGPAALVKVLAALPKPFALPVMIVLHIGDPFAMAFTEWLAGQTGQRVGFARHGQRVSDRAGEVLMAPPGAHLVVRDGRSVLTYAPERHSCRPSVDALFESVAREYGAGGAACLLTGMGRDGASGMLEVRRAGGVTIAQDEATSVVFGMPREAIRIGAAEQVLPIDRIGAAIARLAPAGRAA